MSNFCGLLRIHDLWGANKGLKLTKKTFKRLNSSIGKLVQLSILDERSYSKGDLIHMDSISTFRASAHNKCTCPYRMQMFVPFENASKNIAE